MPDSSLYRAAAPRLRPLQLLLPARLHRSIQLLLRSDPGLHPLSAAARRLRPLQLLLSTASVSTDSRLRPLRLLLPDCVRFNSAPRWRPLRLLLPDCVRFNCCSPIAFASAAAVLEDSGPAMSTILEYSSWSSRFKYEGRASL